MPIDPQAFLNFVRARRSERAMWPGAIPREELDEIVEAGLWAPSGSNQQPWHFAVVTNRGLIREIAGAVGARLNTIRERISSSSALRSFEGYARYLTFFGDASALVCAFAEPYRALLEKILARYAPEVSGDVRANASALSVAAAVENILLAAHARGYAACFLTGPLIARDEIEAKLKPRGDWELIAAVAIGHRLPDREPPKAPARRARAETVSFFE